MAATTVNDDRARLSQPDAYLNPQRNCDVVMKGGITSGVVYPLAVCELATKFRFRSVGGTSAGAIAAAASAAAEYGRLAEESTGTRRPGQGFAGLAAMQQWLSEGKNLTDLFQPNKSTAGIYDLLLAFIAKPKGWDGKVTKWVMVLWQLLRVGLSNVGALVLLATLLPGLTVLVALEWAPGELWLAGVVLLAGTAAFLVALLQLARKRIESGVLALVAWAGLMWWMYRLFDVAWPHWAASVAWLLVVGGGVLGLFVSIALKAVKTLPENNFGLTTGSPELRPGQPMPMSDWLSRQINSLAGLDGDGPPLTFGDLWAGPRDSAPSQDEWDEIACSPAINLEMLTTCLSEGRPYRMPRDFRSLYYFRPAELKQYLPDGVVAFMCAHPSPAADDEEAERRDRIRDEFGMYPLPEARNLPVIFATRMSLSFPGLISAVPLYGVDYSYRVETPDPAGDETDPRAATNATLVPERTWFSDGGISSNFPVSFFDQLLPRWPTFGINLRKFHPAHRKMTEPPINEACHVYMPRDNNEGILAWRTRFPRNGLGGMAGFASSILDTMQNWADNNHLQVPGFRDRIAHVSHDDSEGGMNLSMPAETLEALSERGRLAGARLARYYTEEPADGELVDCPTNGSDSSGPRKIGWSNHRWVRLRTTLAVLERMLLGLHSAYVGDPAQGAEPYSNDLGRDESATYDWNNQAQRNLARWLMAGTEPTNWPLPPAEIGTGLMGMAAELAYYDAHQPADGTPDERPQGPALPDPLGERLHTLASKAPSPQPELKLVPGSKRDC